MLPSFPVFVYCFNIVLLFSLFRLFFVLYTVFVLFFCFFFFSSRRRHTRCLSDWSSDVCSSDLPKQSCPALRSVAIMTRERARAPHAGHDCFGPAGRARLHAGRQSALRQADRKSVV